MFHYELPEQLQLLVVDSASLLDSTGGMIAALPKYIFTFGVLKCPIVFN